MSSISKCIVLTFFFMPLVLSGQVITVKQDGSGDFIGIQAAIDASVHGDTILVWPGTYLENLNYNGKSICIGSLNMTTGDESYIRSTIIDGNQNGSCILVNSQETNACIYGFTIENGSGISYGGFETHGGGIHIDESQLDIINCIIQYNRVKGSAGGIRSKESKTYLSGTTIRYNQAYNSGGGIITSYYDTIVFDTVNLCSIYNNYGAVGSDIYKGNYCPPLDLKLDTFTVAQPDIYFLFSYDGHSLYSKHDISVQMNAASIEQAAVDLYVSPDGDNANSGLSADEPLKNIWYALSKILPDSNNSYTIHLMPGTWSQSMGEYFPLHIKSFVNLTGTHRDSCILDAEMKVHHIGGNIQDNSFNIRNLTCTRGRGYEDPPRHGSFSFPGSDDYMLENLRFTDNHGYSPSVGASSGSNGAVFKNILFDNNAGGRTMTLSIQNFSYVVPFTPDTVQMINCIFRDNRPPDTAYEYINGGSVSIKGAFLPEYEDYQTCIFINCEFTDNLIRDPDYFTYNPGFLVVNGAQAYLVNCTMGNNFTSNPNGIHTGVSNFSKLHIYNSILYDQMSAELYLSPEPAFWYFDTCELDIHHSLIRGGEDGIVKLNNQVKINYGPYNIDTNPMWDTTSSMFPYGLMEGSPCIDAGTMEIPSFIELPETDIAGNPRLYNGYVDMGAYEFGPWVGIDKYHPTSNIQHQSLLSVWPNPFRSEATISYEMPENGQCIIRIYDLKSRCIRTLINSQGFSGRGEIKWKGVDDSGAKIPPGTYIVSMMINGKESDAIKIVKQ